MRRLSLTLLLLCLMAGYVAAGEINMPPAPPPPACTENCTQSATSTTTSLATEILLTLLPLIGK